MAKEAIKDQLKGLFDYDLDRSFADLYQGEYTFNVLCQTTVPEALICFFDSENFEDCIKKAVLTNKDTDTAAAIAGAVAGAFYGIPPYIEEQMFMHIPDDFKTVINKLEQCCN